MNKQELKNDKILESCADKRITGRDNPATYRVYRTLTNLT